MLLLKKRYSIPTHYFGYLALVGLGAASAFLYNKWVKPWKYLHSLSGMEFSGKITKPKFIQILTIFMTHKCITHLTIHHSTLMLRDFANDRIIMHLITYLKIGFIILSNQMLWSRNANNSRDRSDFIIIQFEIGEWRLILIFLFIGKLWIIRIRLN